MAILPFLFILFIFGCSSETHAFAIPSPLEKLLELSWDAVNPNSLDNKIDEVVKGINDIKSELQLAEIAILYSASVKRIEFFIDEYNIAGGEIDKYLAEAMVADWDPDGFHYTLRDLKNMAIGHDTLFAEESIFEVVARKTEGVDKNENKLLKNLKEIEKD